jgi:hypothetical protein
MPRRTKKQKGGCSVLQSQKLPCIQNVNHGVHKYAPTLSQSEKAFVSRYHTNARQTSNQVGKGYFLDVSSKTVGGLPPIQAVFDPKAPIYHPKSNALQQYPKPSFMKQRVQKGGSYDFIVNPETNRKVKLNGKKGREVLRKYMNVQQGGDISNFDPNMTNRTFGCKQPEWNPNCV